MNPGGPAANPALQGERIGAPAPPLSTLHPQTPPIPDHELLHCIGRGSYGEVWLARNKLGTFRAVKIVYRSTFEDSRPFEREFKGIQKFEPISRSHDGLVDILQVGGGEEYFYYVMELADDAEGDGDEKEKSGKGEKGIQMVAPAPDGKLPSAPFPLFPSASYSPKTLCASLKVRGRLPVNECVQIGRALAAALAHLHGHGLVHRDIKPSNIIFVHGVPKLADIGLVADATEARSFVGTEGFIPPEGPGSPQADLYSLGKVLYEISAGQDRRDFPALPTQFKDSADEAAFLELNAVIVKACKPEPRERYQSAEAMHADLGLLQGGGSVRQKRTREYRWAVCKKAGLALLVLAALAASVVLFQRQFARSDLDGLGSPSANMVANMYCDKGLRIVQADDFPQYAEAYKNFHLAIAKDTNFARPYIGLLDLRVRHAIPSLGPTSLEEMHRIAAKLKELAPDSAAADLAESIIHFYDWDFPAAKREAEQAIKTSPGYELGHIWYGYMLMIWRRTSEARTQADISQRLAPSKATSYRLRGHTYYVERNFTDAIHWYRQAIEMDRHELPAHLRMGQAFRAMGDYTNALGHLETAALLRNPGNESETRRSYDKLRQAFKDGGARGYWQEEWKRTETRPDEDFYRKAVVQIHLGDTNAALDWLEKSFVTHERSGFESAMIYLLLDESWDGLHDHPRFKVLLDRIGFTKVMPPKK